MERTGAASDRRASLLVQLRHITLDESSGDEQVHKRQNATDEQLKNTPLFSGPVLASKRSLFPQYGLIGAQLSAVPDPCLFLNMNAPFSAFICGSQGSGKSHTLSCMLENALIESSDLGRVPKPLAAIVFHYDRFTSHQSNQICEAAYLCSVGVPVRVLVSPANQWRMKQAYENLPGLASTMRKPQVIPLYFKDHQLDASRMMTLMALNKNEERVPLYVETMTRILRDMAVERKDAHGVNYAALKERLKDENFSRDQTGPLNMRMTLLESFMEPKQIVGATYTSRKHRHVREEQPVHPAWTFEAGTLTIVDLSCPFVDDHAACDLFSICLELFLENWGDIGRVIALDEAHKFLGATSSSAAGFVESLLQVIRQQRHLASRVIIATQEPTVSPKLLDLCSLTIIHHFESLDWFRTLQRHLAGVSCTAVGTESETEGRDVATIFNQIVELSIGEALLFCPSAVLKPGSDAEGAIEPKKPVILGMGHIKARIRKRVTADGGRSLLAV